MNVTLMRLVAWPTARSRSSTAGRTGRIGTRYRIELLWPPDNAAGLPADAPPEIFTAVREQLGLRLQAATAPTEVLVIDSAERPEEN